MNLGHAQRNVRHLLAGRDSSTIVGRMSTRIEFSKERFFGRRLDSHHLAAERVSVPNRGLYGDVQGLQLEEGTSTTVGRLRPGQWPFKHVAGELVRIVGKLVDQAYRNGNGNWDKDHETMWRFVAERIANDPIFREDEQQQIRETVEKIIRDEACPDLSGDRSTYYFVNERVIDWCMAHPEPIPFEPDGRYRR